MASISPRIAPLETAREIPSPSTRTPRPLPSRPSALARTRPPCCALASRTTIDPARCALSFASLLPRQSSLSRRESPALPRDGSSRIRRFAATTARTLSSPSPRKRRTLVASRPASRGARIEEPEEAFSSLCGRPSSSCCTCRRHHHQSRRLRRRRPTGCCCSSSSCDVVVVVVSLLSVSLLSLWPVVRSSFPSLCFGVYISRLWIGLDWNDVFL